MTDQEKKALLLRLAEEKGKEFRGKELFYETIARHCGRESITAKRWLRDDGKWLVKGKVEERLWHFFDYRLLDNGDVEPMERFVPPDSPSPALQLIPDDTPIRVEVASRLSRITSRLMKAKALTGFMLEMQLEEEGLMTEVLQEFGLEQPSGSALKETLRKFRQQLTDFVNQADPIDVKLVFFRGKKPGDPEKK